MPGNDLPLELLHLPIKFLEMLSQVVDQLSEGHGQLVAGTLALAVAAVVQNKLDRYR